MSNQDYAITGPDREKVLEELVRLQQQYEELHTLTADIMREQGREIEDLQVTVALCEKEGAADGYRIRLEQNLHKLKAEIEDAKALAFNSTIPRTSDDVKDTLDDQLVLLIERHKAEVEKLRVDFSKMNTAHMDERQRANIAEAQLEAVREAMVDSRYHPHASIKKINAILAATEGGGDE